MKIRTIDFFGQEQTNHIEKFVNENIYENDFSSIGRLINILAEKGQLSAEEVYFIAKGYDGSAKFVEE